MSSQKGTALVFGLCMGLAGLANANGQAIWRHTQGDVALAAWQNDAWTSMFNFQKVADSSWAIVSVADLNGDGDDDILWRNSASGELYTFNVKDGKYLSENDIVKVSNLNWELIGTGDMDGDGDADLVWRNRQTGEVYLYAMQGSRLAEGYDFMTIPLEWKIEAVKDMDNDGTADLFWRNQRTGENYIFFMKKFGLKAELEVPKVSQLDWKVLNVSDVDADTKPDIVWRNATTGDVVLWALNDGRFKQEIELPKQDVSQELLDVEDIDGDGVADLLWQDKAQGKFSFWRVKGGKYDSTQSIYWDKNWKFGGWSHGKKTIPDVAPFGATAVYLRGSMNAWAAVENAQFAYKGNKAYQLKLNLAAGDHQFKVADSAWLQPNCGGPTNTAITAKLDNESVLSCGANSGNIKLSLTQATDLTFDFIVQDKLAPKLTIKSTIAEQDLLAPTGRIQGILATYTIGDSASYTISAADNKALASASLIVKNAAGTQVHSDTPTFTGTTGTKAGSFTTTAWAAGIYTYVLSVKDAATNVSTPVTGTFEVKAAAETVKPTGAVVGIAASYTLGSPVSYTLNAADNLNLASLNFVVKNAAGTQVHTNTAALTGTTGSKTGSFATTDFTAGAYSYVLSVKDAAGNAADVSGSFEVKAAADTVKPTGAVTGIAASYTVGNAVSYSLTAGDNLNLASLSFVVKNAAGTQVHADSATLTGATGSKTGSFATTGFTAGVYSYLLSVKDAAGNATDVSGSFEVKAAADTVKPTGAVTGIAASYTVGNAVSYSLTAGDNLNLASLSFVVKNAAGTQVHADTATLTGTTGSKTGSIATTGFTAGVYSYVLSVKDAAGNAADVSGSFEVKAAADTVKPTGAVAGIAASYTVGNAVSYSLTAGDNLNLASLSFVVKNAAGTQVHADSATLTGATGSKIGSFATTGFTVGVYSYLLSVKDAAGNATDVSGSFEVKAAPDTVKPTGAVAGIAASYTVGNAVSYSLTAGDNLNLASLSFVVKNAAGTQVHADSATLTGATGSKTGSFATTGFAVGVYSYLLSVKDAAGNTTDVSGSFEVKAVPDTTKPTGAVTGIAASYTAGNAVSYSLTAGDNLNLASLSFVVKNAAGTQVHADSASLTGTAGSKTGSFATTGFAAGTYSFSLTVTDAATNSTSVTGSFNVVAAIDGGALWAAAPCAGCHNGSTKPKPGDAGWSYNRTSMISSTKTMFGASSWTAAQTEAVVDWLISQKP